MGDERGLSAIMRRVDPGDYARRKAEQVQRAKELREQRSSGNLSEEHTFKPKWEFVGIAILGVFAY